MKIERTTAGVEARLKIAGFGRFIGAAFLVFWLTGWVIGEAFALCMLTMGAWALLTGRPPEPGREPLAPEAALPLGLFLLFWLTFWTLGGVLAGRELLRLLFGRDRILAWPDGLEVEQKCGLFRSREKWPRDALRRFYRKPGRGALCVESTGGTTELTRLGTVAERAELEQMLNAEFQLSAQPSSQGALPPGWCEISSPERDTVLVKDPATRRKQATVAWTVCGLVSSVALYLVSATQKQPGLWGMALSFVVIAALISWGAVWLSLGRKEWKLGKGRLILQRRFGQNRTSRFEAVSLELVEDNSGDGGPSYQLTAVAAGAPPQPCSYRMGKHRRTIFSQSDDPTEPRNLGRWLSQRCQLPLADQTTTEAKTIQLEALKAQLANSGRLGRVTLRLIERLAPAQSDKEG
jgi:hypothetical protein